MCSTQSFNYEMITSSSTAAESCQSDECYEAMRILLKTNDFLIDVLLYLTINIKFAATDTFLSSVRVIQNIIDFSSRSSLTQSFADNFFDALMNELTTDKIQQMVMACVDNTVANENLMVETALYIFPRFHI